MASLVKQLDRAIAEHEDKKLCAFVNFIGPDRQALEKAATEFGTKHKITAVPIVVPVDQPDGPADYAIAPEAQITVMIYRDQTVRANHAFPAGGLNDKSTATIMDDLEKTLE